MSEVPEQEAEAQRVSALLRRLLAGDRLALSRTLTLLENDLAGAQALERALKSHQKADDPAAVLGFTGPPGAGKSTLVSAVVGAYRQSGKTVGVLAVDPTSPLSGGAILGDRLRMGEHAGDDGVFVRSLATRGHLGGVAPATQRLVEAMAAAGFDVIIIETVGVGQAEVEIAELADVKVVVSAPGLGDEVQAIKAGILEIADILVVNKADLPLADETARHLRDMLALRQAARQRVPVLLTGALNGEGVDDLVAALDASLAAVTPQERRDRSRARIRRHLADLVGDLAKDRAFSALGSDAAGSLAAVESGELSLHQVAKSLLYRLAEEGD